MDDKLIRLARKVKTLEDELSHLSQIKDLEGLLVASTDMNSRYKKSINETVGMYKEYISNTKKELTDSFEEIKKDYDSKKDSYKKNMNNLEAKINKVKDDIQKVCTSIDKSIEDIQKDILKDIKDKNTQILNEIGKKDKELKEVKTKNASLVKDLKALKDLVNRLELQKGDDGKSAYDIACELGFKGTKEEWIKSLHGKDGQDIELRGLRAFSDVKNDNKMYARKNKKWVEVENYDDTEIRQDISELQGEQTTQNNNILQLQTENTRLKATLPTTTGTGENITLSNTAELEFIQPPLPRGNSKQDTAILPTGYTQLDYIESTGTQYIDTGYTPVQGDDFEFKNVTTVFNENNKTLFSAGTGDYQLIFVAVQQTGYFRYYGTTANSFSYPYLTNGNIKITNGGLYFNDTLKVQGSYEGTVNTTLNIFRRADNTNYISAKMGEIIITNNGTIKHDYIPCKNTSNEVGLYDLVSKTFFGNSGTGTFTAGNTVTVPNPEYPIAISNVTGDVEVKIQNKNLFNVSKAETGKNIFSSGIITNSAGMNISDYIYVGNFNSMTIQFDDTGSTSWNYCCFDENKEVVSGGNNGYSARKVTHAITSDVKYIRFSYPNTATNIMFSSNDTTHTPHKEQTYTFPLGTQRMYLGDYLADDGIHHVRGSITLDGTENFENWTSGTNTIGFKLANVENLKDIASSSRGILFSNYFIASTSQNALTNNDLEGIATTVGNLYFRINKTTASNLANFKTWLSTHNTIVEYELAEETVTPYTTEQQSVYNAIKQAISYEEQTNISGSSDESNPIFSVEAYQSIKLVLAG